MLKVQNNLYDFEFKDTNFSVTLNWTEQDRVSYSVSVDPSAELVRLMNNVWEIIGNYNTLYNVSIEATLCDMYSKTTNIKLEYGKPHYNMSLT